MASFAPTAFVAIDAVGREGGASQVQNPTERQNLASRGLGNARVAGVCNADA